jgi:hypothetical protein
MKTYGGPPTTVVAGLAAAAVLALAGCGAAAAAPSARTVTHTVTASPSPHKARHHHRAAPSPAPQPAAPAAPAANAEAVVDQFYQDITDHNYPAAWALGGDNIGGAPYGPWVAGYATTASLTLGTVSEFNATTVDAELIATQTDGSVRTYQGTYTVANGVIVAANITGG